MTPPPSSQPVSILLVIEIDSCFNVRDILGSGENAHFALRR